MIRLFESTATDFSSNGLGCLSDAIRCEVVEERNGEFELEMEYPVDGIHYGDLALRRIIVAKPNPYDEPQAFRIYSISSPLNCIVTVNAAHISYDLSGIPASAFTATSLSDALNKLTNFTKASGYTPFNFSKSSEKVEVTSTMKIDKPTSLRSILGGMEGSVLDIYRGEYKFDNFNVILYNNRGTDNGTTISYGKNLTDLTQDENCSNVYTGIYPFWKATTNDTETLVELPEKIVNAEGTFDFKRILTVDFTSDFEDAPTVDQLRARANSYISANKIGIPKVSIKVSFIPLSQTEEYKDYVTLERIQLCDIVTVIFPKLNISTKSECTSITYDAISDRYISINLGEPSNGLAQTISNQSTMMEDVVSSALASVPSYGEVDKSIADAVNASKVAIDKEIADSVAAASKQITGGNGGYVSLHSTAGRNTPDEILILDTPEPVDANGVSPTSQTVWRWNKNGFGMSSDYGRNYSLAITKSNGGTIDASKINVTNLNASNIKSGQIDAAQIAVINLNADNIKSGHMSADYINGGTIDASKINVTNIKAGNITSGTFEGCKLYLETADKNSAVVTVKDPSFSDWYADMTNSGFHAWGHDGYLRTDRVDYEADGINGWTLINGVWVQDIHITHGGAVLPTSIGIEGGTAGRVNLIPIAGDPMSWGYTYYQLKVSAGISSNGRIHQFDGYTWIGDSAKAYDSSDKYILHVGGKVFAADYDKPSDKRFKHDIEDIDERYIKVFDMLKPKVYKFNLDGENAKNHFGYIAQDVLEAFDKAGLDSDETVIIPKLQTLVDEENGITEERFALNYTELMMLYDLKIRQQEKRINDLEARLAALESKLTE